MIIAKVIVDSHGTPDYRDGICNHNRCQSGSVYLKITYLLRMQSKKIESSYANMCIWKYRGVLTT